MKELNVLYIHGMGGGEDSRIPMILYDYFNNKVYVHNSGENCKINIVVRTYNFAPKPAYKQIEQWIQELKPCLVIGESLGAIQAIRIKYLPHILVSPSLGAPLWLGYLSALSLIPGVKLLLEKIYKPKTEERQALIFNFNNLRQYIKHGKEAKKNMPYKGSKDYFYAFFGTEDHYRKWGVVSIRLYQKYFGNNFTIYKGTHFMEEEYVYSLLIPKIIEVIGCK